MIALKIGTLSWENKRQIDAGEVEFRGEWITAKDGVTPLMVWDDQLQNARQMTQDEIVQTAADKGKRDLRAANLEILLGAQLDAIMAGIIPTDPVMAQAAQKVLKP